MERRSNLNVFLALISALMVIVACGNQTPAGAKPPVKIAETDFLTGSYGSFGQRTEAGANLAAKQINDKGGILGGRQVQLAFYDEGYNTDTITASAKKAIADGNIAIIGGWDASTCPGLAQVGKTSGIPIVITSCGSTAPMKIGHPALVQTGPPYGSDEYPDNVISINAKWMVQNGYKTVVAVAQDSAYSYLFDTEMTKALKGTTTKWLGNIYFAYGSSDTKSEITKAVGMKPDLLFLQFGGHDALVSAILNLRELGYSGTIMGNYLALTDAELVTLGSKGEGVYSTTTWLADPKIPASVTFDNQYKAANGGQEPDAFTEQSYESAMILMLALDKAGSTSDLAKINQGFHTLDWVTPRGAKVHFDNSGRILFDSFIILKAVNQKFVPVSTVAFTYGR